MDGMLSKSPFQSFFRWRSQHRLTVLAYHGIKDVYTFDQQLDYLVEHLHPVSLQEVLAAIDNDQSLSSGATLITFDDGERTLYEVGLPLLQARGIPAVAFVIVGLIDTDKPYWWTEVEVLIQNGGRTTLITETDPLRIIRHMKNVSDDLRMKILAELRSSVSPELLIMLPQLSGQELREMERAGIAIGSHTMTHPCLSQCSPTKVRKEIKAAHEGLMEILGHPPSSFAYPNGDIHPAALQILRELDYQAAFLFDHRLSQMPPSDPLHISRLRVDSTTPMDRFRIILSGFHPALHRARGGV